jgi:hypothetical protein
VRDSAVPVFNGDYTFDAQLLAVSYRYRF